MFKSAD